MADWENLLDDDVEIEIKKDGEEFENEEIVLKQEAKPKVASAPKEPGEKVAKKNTKTEKIEIDNTPKEVTQEEKLRIEKFSKKGNEAAAAKANCKPVRK